MLLQNGSLTGSVVDGTVEQSERKRELLVTAAAAEEQSFSRKVKVKGDLLYFF